MPAVPAPDSIRPSLNAYDAACSRLLRTRYRSTCRRRATATSDRRWCSAASIGYGPSWSPRSSSSPVPTNLLRQVVYEGLREDKPASEVRRAVPHPKAAAEKGADVRARPPRG
jgi:hypothetical protein